MSQDIISALAIFSIEKYIVDEIARDNVLNKFTRSRNIRMQFFNFIVTKTCDKINFNRENKVEINRETVINLNLNQRILLL